MIYKIFISFSSTNIHVNITNIQDQTIFKQSCFSKKFFSNEIFFYRGLLVTIKNFLKTKQIKKLIIIISGFHKKRFFFLKDFFNLFQKIKIYKVFFISSKPFNGCRKKKKRRLLFF